MPIYQHEGEAFGEAARVVDRDHKVAILSQNDDYGKGYVEGFKSAIEGADNIEVVKELTYEATDTSVDAQLTELAASGADVFFNAMSITPLDDLVAAEGAGAGLEAQLVPAVEHVEPRRRSSQPGGAAAFPGIYTVVVLEVGGEPGLRRRTRTSWSSSAALKQYGDYPDGAGVPALRVELDGRRDARAGLPEDDRADARRAS